MAPKTQKVNAQGPHTVTQKVLKQIHIPESKSVHFKVFRKLES